MFLKQKVERINKWQLQFFMLQMHLINLNLCTKYTYIVMQNKCEHQGGFFVQ